MNQEMKVEVERRLGMLFLMLQDRFPHVQKEKIRSIMKEEMIDLVKQAYANNCFTEESMEELSNQCFDKLMMRLAKETA